MRDRCGGLVQHQVWTLNDEQSQVRWADGGGVGTGMWDRRVWAPQDTIIGLDGDRNGILDKRGVETR